ncbi:uncharacterized protein TNCV_4426811 [Trichonephila clavipes]|nr:uncharacterized protein TNCV_4426811 [Trichonephila clavipes]
MEQNNKNITNAETLTGERERNLVKENGETQQANINGGNMQDYDDQQHSEKDIVQPKDISNTSTEKCLENVGYEFENYSLTWCSTHALLSASTHRWGLLNREIKLKSLSQTRWSCHYDVVEALKDNYGNVVVVSIFASNSL